MGDLTNNLSRNEFKCDCGKCGKDMIDYELVTRIQEAVDHFSKIYGKVRVLITDGSRCVGNNEKIQKAVNPNYVPYSSQSQHMEFKAADFRYQYFNGTGWVIVEPMLVYAYFDKRYPTKYGIGLYSNRIHLDVRATRARWDATK